MEEKKYKNKIYTLSHPITKEIRYIGATSEPLNKRKCTHISAARKKNINNFHTIQWIRSLLKNNLEPEIELLDNCDDSTWKDTERYWIAQFRAWGFRLVNTAQGGVGVGTMSEETKNKIRQCKLGSTVSGETKKKISIAASKYKATEETKQKQSLSLIGKNKGNKISEEVKQRIKNLCKVIFPIIQYSKDGNFIKEYPSIRNASKLMKLSPDGIKRCCNLKATYCGKYTWRYKDSDFTPKTIVVIKPQKYKRKILQYSLDNIFIKEWNSLTEAQIGTSIYHQNIYSCCKQTQKHAGGFIWKYKNEKEELKKDKPINVIKKSVIPKKPVLQYTMNNEFIAEYESVSEAVRATNCHRGHIGDCCKNKIRSTGGFIWKFKNVA